MPLYMLYSGKLLYSPDYIFMRGLHIYDRTGVVRDHAITALIYYS